MSTIGYKKNQQGINELHLEKCSGTSLAHEFGTPLFAYSRSAIEAAWRSFSDVLEGREHLVCYAIKANSNLGVLSILARLGSGFDIVSAGELKRVIAAGGEPGKTVFSGVGKLRSEMEFALESGIRCFNVESLAELARLEEVAAAHGVIAPVSLRINPDVDAGTHPYISTGLKENKFGIEMETAREAYKTAASCQHLKVQGIDCHIGSQLTEVAPYKSAVERLVVLIDELSADGIEITHIDVGGGQGISYQDETPMDLQAWADVVTGAIGNRVLEIVVEPGRSVVGNAGVLLTRAQYKKTNGDKNFLIVDAAMNDLLRPPLYSAWQDIKPVLEKDCSESIYDVVGPICESSDFLGKDRALKVEQDDLVAVMSAGAYGFVMSSNYNTRPRAAEVIVDGDQVHLVRERETVEQLLQHESVVPAQSGAS